MNFFTHLIVYILSYFFGAFVFPQIIGSIRAIRNGFKVPYTFTLVLWSTIFVAASIIMWIFGKNLIFSYLAGLILPFVFTLRTKNIE